MNIKNSYAYPLSVGLIVALILAVLSWAALQEIDRKVAAANVDKLQSLLDATEQGYKSWIRQQQADAQIWAGAPEVQNFAKTLRAIYASVESHRGGNQHHVGHDTSRYLAKPEFEPQHIALESSPVQPNLKVWLKPVLTAKGHNGYFIIAPDGITLASSRHENIGIPNLLQQQPGFLEQVWAGNAAVSLPQVSDVLLPDASGELHAGLPTMFVAAPIYDEKGELIAALAFRINPDSDFTKTFTQTRIRHGESLAYNRQGLLLDHSRYEDQLRIQGVLGDDQDSMLNVDLHQWRDDQGQVHRVAFYGLAEGAVHGAINVDGYRNYRGELVIGAWRWLPEYDLGLAVEQEYSAAFEVLGTVRAVMWLLVGMVLLTMAALAYLFVSGRQQIEKSESRLSGIIEMAEDAIISIDENQKIILVNKAAERIFGYCRAEILGQAVTCLMPAESPEVHHQHVEGFAGTLDGKIMATSDGTVFGMRKNGEAFPIEAVASKQRVAGKTISTVVLRDISRRLKFEADLRKEQERARRYLDTVEAIMVALDADGKVRMINRKGCEILDRAEQNIIGQDWFDLVIPEAEREEARLTFQQYVGGDLMGGHYHEDVVIDRNGKQYNIAWHSSLIVEEGDVIKGMLSGGLDVSSVKQSEHERERLQLQLMQAQKVEAIGQLTGGIAHDFNNMLASIRGYTELAQTLLGRDTQNKLPNYLAQVHHTCLRAAELVDKLMAFSRGSETELTSQSLLEQVERSFGILDSVLPSTIEVHKQYDLDLPNVMVDAVQLDQVVVNLCINARDAMDGKGRIDVGLRWVGDVGEDCISCHRTIDGEFIELSIKDSGAGIEPEIMDKLFNPFFTTKEVGKGTGMGLAMVHGIVHGHDGHVRVVNAPEGGAEFLLYFPVAEDVARVEEVGDADSLGIETPIECEDKRILLVDDEESVANMLGAVLRHVGFGVEVHTDSLEAKRRFEEQPDSFDLLLTDQTMPKMTGIELVKYVLSVRPDLPVVLCTGYSADVDEVSALALGVRAYLPKPLNTAQLIQTLNQLLTDSNRE